MDGAAAGGDRYRLPGSFGGFGGGGGAGGFAGTVVIGRWVLIMWGISSAEPRIVGHSQWSMGVGGQGLAAEFGPRLRPLRQPDVRHRARGAGRRYRCTGNARRGVCPNRLTVLESVARARILEAVRLTVTNDFVGRLRQEDGRPTIG